MAKTYDTYKDSGIAWIGEIPSEWEVGLIGKYFDEINNPNTNQEETNTLQFKMGEIISKKDGDSKYNPETIEAYNVVEPGTIMINGLNLSFDLVSQRVAQVHERGAITSTYLALSPVNGMESDYAKYLLKAYDNNKALHAMGRGLRATLSYGKFRTEPVLVPNSIEQHSIASFLDTKCGEIDALISLQEEMISELQAYKQSVITEAVTKGLNPNAKMKDSGVEWIGEIPEGWKVCRLKNNVSLINVTSTSTNKIGLENIESGTGKFRQTSSEFEGNGIEFVENDIVYGKLRPYLQKVWKATFKGNAVGDFFVFRVNAVTDSDFVKYVFLSDGFTKEVVGSTFGAKMPRVSSEFILTMNRAFPPLSEQQSIATYLDEKTSQIDSLIALKQEKIQELKDYKKSIIYEYVTGKKRV